MSEESNKVGFTRSSVAGMLFSAIAPGLIMEQLQPDPVHDAMRAARGDKSSRPTMRALAEECAHAADTLMDALGTAPTTEPR